MSPILGIWASSVQASKSTAFDSIATVTVGAGGSANIQFNSIPTTYKHLQIRWIGRITAAANDENLQIQVGNGSVDTATNYSQHGLYGTGTSVASFGNANTTGAISGRLTGATSPTSVFGAGVIDILDYANTNKYKTFRGLSGHEQNSGATIMWVASGSWRSTSAINTIQLNQLFGSGNFAQYSTFALYGIK